EQDKNHYLRHLQSKRRRGRWKAGGCLRGFVPREARANEMEAGKLGPAIITELCRFMPSEILICPGILDFKDVTAYIKQHTSALVELREDACYQDRKSVV